MKAQKSYKAVIFDNKASHSEWGRQKSTKEVSHIIWMVQRYKNKHLSVPRIFYDSITFTKMVCEKFFSFQNICNLLKMCLFIVLLEEKKQ